MKKCYTLLLLLTSVVINAQNPLVVKDVTSTLKPTGNSAKADLNYAKWNGKIFYAGTGSNMLCVTDGTTAGTIGISALGGTTNVSAIIPAQDFVYIITSDITFSPTIASTDKIWKSDGTAAGTTLVYSFTPSAGFSNVGIFYSVPAHYKNYSVDGNILYFSAFDATNGKELWKTDGTPAGTVMIKDIKAGTGTSQSSGFCKIPSTTLFIAQSVGLESKLWKTDGTTTGTEQIPVAEPFYIVNQDMAKLGDKVIFFAHNTVDGYEPYVSDGTAAGTFMLKNINPSGNSLTTQAMGLHLKIAGQYCYFIANNGTNNALWRTDGTIAGTIEVIPNVTNGISDAGYSTTDAENIWFVNYTGTNATQQLYKSNGTVEGSSLIYSNLSYAQNLTTYKGALCFQSRDVGQLYNAEVWRSDGLTVNTELALDVAALSASSDPYAFFELNDKLYFFGKNGSTHNLYQYTGDFTFNGSVNNDWNNKNNWNSMLKPGITDEVTIPVGQNVNVNANAYAKNAMINGNVNLVTGNLDLYGYALMNNNAKITLNTNNLNLKGANSSLVGSSTSHVVTNGTGKVTIEKMNASRGTVLLPIGTGTSFHETGILNNGTSDTFSVRVENGVASNYVGETQGTAITEKAVNTTWHIGETTPGGSDVALTFRWNASQELANFNRNTAKIGHYNGSGWDMLTSALSGSGPYTLQTNNVSSFSPFIVVNEELLSNNQFENANDFMVYPNPSNGNFTIQVPDSFIGSRAIIYNLLGQSIKEFSIDEVNQNTNLEKGVYLLQIQKGNQVSTKKIIIQ